MKTIISVLIIVLAFSCNSSQKEHQNFIVLKLKQVDKTYQYTPNSSFRYKGEIYAPQKRIEYKNGDLQKVEIYKSEGVLTYSIANIKCDTNLIEIINEPLRGKLLISGNYLFFNSIKYPAQEQKTDSIFVISQSNLNLFVTH